MCGHLNTYSALCMSHWTGYLSHTPTYTDPAAFVHHQKNECKLRSVACRYCKTLTPLQALYDHEQYCGGKTIPCTMCSKMVAQRKMEIHLASEHGINPSLMDVDLMCHSQQPLNPVAQAAMARWNKGHSNSTTAQHASSSSSSSSSAVYEQPGHDMASAEEAMFQQALRASMGVDMDQTQPTFTSSPATTTAPYRQQPSYQPSHQQQSSFSSSPFSSSTFSSSSSSIALSAAQIKARAQIRANAAALAADTAALEEKAIAAAAAAAAEAQQLAPGSPESDMHWSDVPTDLDPDADSDEGWGDAEFEEDGFGAMHDDAYDDALA
jgi:hypothetical protein